ncbi:TIGR02270 family protein [Pyxidicoccus trucidator]|uniref:TIGR02270 family protein n=1 Tax=Pyxidicoccus trucidator TaxID=2709662 RepID=UPI0013DB74CC|nr:TIGR02270 family protein [Pyxidicoccus trucidator]
MGRMLRDVVEEHLDEASWQWLQRGRSLLAPDYDLTETAVVEERLMAHVDGLVAAGSDAVEAILAPALVPDDPSRVAAAALALLEGGEAGWLLELGLGDPELRPLLRAPLALAACPDLDARLGALLSTDVPAILADVVGTLAARGALPSHRVGSFLQHEDARVRDSALEGAIAAPRQEFRRPLLGLLGAGASIPCAALMDAGLVHGLREAWVACARAVEAWEPEALVLWALGGGVKDVARLVELLGQAPLRAPVLWALGFSGRVEAADACLTWMEDPKVAALAGEAFGAITGLRLEGDFSVARDEDSEASEEDDPEADLTLRPEDDLPLPRAQAVAAWWRSARPGFESGRRYLRGRPLDAAVLMEALAVEPMRRRHVLARELALRTRGACRVQTRARVGLQRAMLQQVVSSGVQVRLQAPLAQALG